MKSICVFCGASPGKNGKYVESAGAFGRLLARHSIRLIYGGGRLGLMGMLADTVLEAGGQVVGVIPRSLMRTEVAHSGLSELHVVETMHARKAMMAELSDAFAVLPGGFGTLDEMCEILTWNQLGIIHKPIGLLNTEGYFDKFLDFLDFIGTEGFIHSQDRVRLLKASGEKELLDQLVAHYSHDAPVPPVV